MLGLLKYNLYFEIVTLVSFYTFISCEATQALLHLYKQFKMRTGQYLF